ncbi:MAG TPA: hypothetical protein VMB05_00390 [Solirubrobacteraceae bacterium]|nr:hypothetical protein [Solirubrobacteraceae bacterium]
MTKRAVRPLLATAFTCAFVALAFAASSNGATKTPKVGAPAVSTGSVRVQGASTTLLGTVNPRGSATTYNFEYGPTVAYGKKTTTATLPAGTSTIKVGQAATGLLSGYHYRLVASNSSGAKQGKDRTFAPRKSRHAKFNLDKPKEATVYGGSLTLSGVLSGSGNAGRQLVLQESPYPYLTSFATIPGTPVTTTAAGAFSFRIPRLLTSTQYRVSTLDPRPLYSSLLTVQAAYKVTLKVKTSKHGGLARLYGTVTPAVVGAHIFLQLNKKVRPGKTEKTEERTTRFTTQFTTTTKRGTKTLSRFSMVAKVRKGGSYRARVEPVKKGALVAGNSGSVLLHSAGR